MPVVTICNHKGGTGKTTSTVHIATALGLSGYRTLAIDLDPQGFLTRTLGWDEPAEGDSVIRLFKPDATIDATPRFRARHFDFIPSSTTLTKLMRRLNNPTDVLWLRETLRKGHPYDFILIDTAAAITVYILNALTAADHVLVPVMPDYQPVIGAEQTWMTCRLVREKLNPDLGEVLFLITSVDARKTGHAVYRQQLRKKFGDSVLSAMVRTSTSLARRSTGGVTVFDRDLTARGALDYAVVTDELLERIGHAGVRTYPEARTALGI